MLVISIKYTCKWRVKFAPNYVFTICGICYNTKSGKVIKQIYKSGCVGYNILGKFYSATKLRQQIEPIPKEKTPF